MLSRFQLHFETPLSTAYNWFPNLRGLTAAKNEANVPLNRAWFADIVIYHYGGKKADRTTITRFDAYIEVKHFSDEESLDERRIRDDLRRLSGAKNRIADSCFIVFAYDVKKERKRLKEIETRSLTSRIQSLSSGADSYSEVWEIAG